MKHAPYNREFWRNYEGYQRSNQVNTPQLIRAGVIFVVFFLALQIL